MESKDQRHYSMTSTSGVQYDEKLDLQKIFNKDGAWEKFTLSHMRSIGDRKISYTANLIVLDGPRVEVSQWIILKFETNLDGNELAGFKKEWEDNVNWRPQNWRPKNGAVTVEIDAKGIMENILQRKTPRFSK